MIFTKDIFAKSVALIFICCFINSIIAGQNKEEVIVEGKVFGRSLKDLVELQGIPNQQNIFVEVLKSSSSEIVSRFIKVKNVYRSKTEKLAKTIFNVKKIWAFILERDATCDEKIKDWKDTKEILLFKYYDELLEQNSIQCFRLKKPPNLVDEK